MVSFLKEELPKVNKNTLIILSSNRQDIIKELKGIEKVKLVIDKDNKIARYGLRYTSDLFFSLDKASIDFWFYLKNEDLKNVAKKIKTLS